MKLTLCLLFTLSAACASSRAVEVRGKDVDVYRVHGTWEGEYTSAAAGRTGFIRFTLQGGQRTGLGDVQMGTPDAPRLKIAEMAVDGDNLKGRLDPYTDPNCNCEVSTTFEGVIAGDTISGDFAIAPTAGGPAAPGTWHVTRVGE